MADIKLVIFDVDGVITDCKLYLDPDGREWRSSHVRDGLGLKNLHHAGIATAIISGRAAGGLDARMAALGVEHRYWSEPDKLPIFLDLLARLGLEPENVAMMGDDTPDLPLIERCALGLCPADAHPDVVSACDFVSGYPGGEGAVREASDWLLTQHPPQ